MLDKNTVVFKPIKARVCDRFFDRGKEDVRNWHAMTGVVQATAPHLMILHAGENGVLVITREEYDNPDNCMWTHVDSAEPSDTDIALRSYHARDLNTGFNSFVALLSKVTLDL